TARKSDVGQKAGRAGWTVSTLSPFLSFCVLKTSSAFPVDSGPWHHDCHPLCTCSVAAPVQLRSGAWPPLLCILCGPSVISVVSLFLPLRFPIADIRLAPPVEPFKNVTESLLLRLWESGNPAGGAGFPSAATFPLPLAWPPHFCSCAVSCPAFGLRRRFARREMRSSLRSMLRLILKGARHLCQRSNCPTFLAFPF